MGKVGSFEYVIYSPVPTVCIFCGINSILKYSNFAQNGAREIKCSSLNGGEDGEYNMRCSIMTLEISATQKDFFLHWVYLTKSASWAT